MWQADYESFGQANETLSTVTKNLRFAGQYHDRESGLYYNYFRDYDPNLGRYLQSDPIGLDAGLNTYIYVNANPLIWVDPLGLASLGDMLNNPGGYLPALPGQSANTLAGYGDGLTGGITSAIRDGLGIGGGICTGTPEYEAGEAIGTIVTLVSAARAGAGVAKGVTPTTKQLEKFQKQLQEHGAKSLERSQRKIQRRLNEHTDKLDQIKKNGGQTSSVEREIRNFQREIEAIKQTLGNSS